MGFDIIIRHGTVVDGSGAPARRADVAIRGDRVVLVGPDIDGPAGRVIDASDQLVTPGFVEVRTGVASSAGAGAGASAGGVTSVVVDEFGAWSSTALDSVDRPAGTVNVGALVRHADLRLRAMGERGADPEPPTADEITAVIGLLDDAMLGGALGVTIDLTPLERFALDGPDSGSDALHDELAALADLLGRRGAGVVHVAAMLGDRSRSGSDDRSSPQSILAALGDLGRRSGRPVTFGLMPDEHRPDLHRELLDLVRAEHDRGAILRPHAVAPAPFRTFSIGTPTIFDRCASWASLRSMPSGKRMVAIRDAVFRAALIDEADRVEPTIDPSQVMILGDGDVARFGIHPGTTLAAEAATRGISPAACYIELLLETDGCVVCSIPVPDHQVEAMQAVLDDPLVTLGPGYGVDHDGWSLCPPGPSAFLASWTFERGRWSIEEGIRRLTSDPADLYGLRDRGRLRAGGWADVNVIDPAVMTAAFTGSAHDGPHMGAGYALTLVNGQVVVESGESTGVCPGRPLRALPAS